VMAGGARPRSLAQQLLITACKLVATGRALGSGEQLVDSEYLTDDSLLNMHACPAGRRRASSPQRMRVAKVTCSALGQGFGPHTVRRNNGCLPSSEA
jgi:hypothetical protein